MLAAGRISRPGNNWFGNATVFADSEQPCLTEIQVPHALMRIWRYLGPSRKREVGLEKNVVLNPRSHSQGQSLPVRAETCRSSKCRVSAFPGGLVTSQISGHHPLESLLQWFRVRPKDLHFWHAPRCWCSCSKDPTLSSADVNQWISDWFQQKALVEMIPYILNR